MNITSKTLMTMVAAMAITLTGWAKTLPGVAPMAPDQLAQWRTEETLVNAPKAAAKSDLAFYTGKPYDADLNAYVFPFRNYNPDLCRWTVADPSGFPDGANNWLYVGNNVVQSYDVCGLYTVTAVTYPAVLPNGCTLYDSGCFVSSFYKVSSEVYDYGYTINTGITCNNNGMRQRVAMSFCSSATKDLVEHALDPTETKALYGQTYKYIGDKAYYSLPLGAHMVYLGLDSTRLAYAGTRPTSLEVDQAWHAIPGTNDYYKVILVAE